MTNDDLRSRINHIRATVDLPSLLLSYGVHLQKTGGGYTAKCIHHDDNNPSMSVYAADDHARCFCHSCGFNEDVVGAYMRLSGDDFTEALDALDGGERKHNGKPFATIKDEPPIKKVERIVSVPPEGTPPPIWKRANYRNAEDEWVSLGEPVKVWTYRTHDGAIWYYEARYERTDENGKVKKEPRCWTWGQRGVQPPRWELGFPPAPRPLYGLQELPAAVQVLVCEGPKKAEAARAMLNGTSSVACVAWPGGVNGVSRADWSALDGKEVIISPDADDVGRKAADAVAAKLDGKASKIWILRTDDLPDGWDVADAEGWDKAKFIAHIKERKVEWSKPVEPEPEPMPEMDDIPDEEPDHHAYQQKTTSQVWTDEPADLFSEFIVPPLAHGVLPKVIEDHVFDIAEIINTDPAFGAITAIATVAGLIDDRIKIHLNHGYRESARLWTVCVGEPSTKKSPIMDAVRQPLIAIKKRSAQMESKVIQRQGIIDARHKAKLKEYTDACIKSDSHDIPEPPPPERIERRRIECDNLTREALERVLQDMPTGLIIHADEIAGWIGSMDAYKAAGVKADRALWLRAYNGGPMQIDKVVSGSYLIENWSCTITGGIQPIKLAGIAHQLDDDGLLQRFLIVSSSREGGQGLARAWNHDAAEAWKNLLEHISEIKPGGDTVKLTPEAAAIRDKAVGYIYQIINAKMVSRAFCTALGKWEGTTGRMILTFHVIDCASKGQHPETVPVSAETAQLAIDYMLKHLLPHMVSFYEDGLGQSISHEIAKLIAGRIVARGDVEMTMREMAQFGPSKWRQANEDIQRQTLSRLIEYGWIMPVDTVSNVSRRPSRYHINPNVHTLFEKHRAAEQARIERGREIARKIKESCLP